MLNEKVLAYKTYERTEDSLLSSWGRLDKIDDLWTMIGYYANDSDMITKVKYLEWFNPIYMCDDDYFKKWIRKVIENGKPVAILENVEGREKVYFYINEEAFNDED